MLKESLHGLTKGTELEPLMAALAQGEANGVMMYYALARLAKEQGFDDAAETFIEAANQEAVHAGFYAVLNGKYPKDFWQLVAGVKAAEVKGEASVKALADKVRAAGFTQAADEMEVFAKQEGHHGIILDELLKKYAQKNSSAPAQKTFICSICGYEHVGDAPPATCLICAQPSTAFKEKSAPKTFVCSICGYEHFGDAPPATCPICAQPSTAFKEKSAPKTFVCSICGYEHVGDAPPATCPICGQPSTAFKEKPKLKIQAVRFYDGGFMLKSFACGGGLPEGSIAEEKLRSSLQNYVIDTGKEIILVDTGTPAEMDFPVTEKSVITFGDKIADYVDALKNLGYAPEKVSKILVTHKHPDHTGELRSFPNAKVFISRIEADDMNLTGENIVRVDFTDGAYKNFPACQKITDGVYYIFAPGHTKGNSIVIVDDGEKFFMIHGDVTYTDEALIENKLSVVFEDLNAARDTLKRVRDFIKTNRTVYLSTHTPLGYENLAAQKIMELPDVEETSAAETQSDTPKAVGKKWVCSVCGYEHFGDTPPEICPRCKQPSTAFKAQ